MGNLDGLRVLVTGGGRGIGKVIAKMMKEAGADVVISGSNQETLSVTADELGVQGIAADLGDMSAVDSLIETVGHVDILVNNAGITRDSLFVRQSEEQWNDVLNVNLNAAVRLTRALVPGMMKKRFGRVINISSVVAHMGNVGQTNYITSKAAMTGFTKGLSQEVARRGITVNCVAPGFIETDMTKALDEATVKKMQAQIPSGRFGSPEEVAAVVCFLASKEAGYVTGTTVHVNGGMYV